MLDLAHQITDVFNATFYVVGQNQQFENLGVWRDIDGYHYFIGKLINLKKELINNENKS